MGKRSDIFIRSIRKIVENETENSFVDIDDDVILEYINEGQRHLQELLINNNVNSFVKEYTKTLSPNIEEYVLPGDILDSSSIIKVEYTDNVAIDKPRYYPLRQGTEIDRQSDIAGLPRKYILRDKYDVEGASLLLSPIPSNGTSGIRVIYRQEIDELNKRRGVVSAFSSTGQSIDTLTLDVSGNPPIDSESMEDSEYLCVLDKRGRIKMANIEFDSVNTGTGEVTVSSGFLFETGESVSVGDYVVTGKNSTSHMKLPRRWQDYIKYWAAHSILDQDSNSDANQMANKLAIVQDTILKTAARMNEDYFEIPITEQW